MPSPPVVTATLAELYVKQGLIGRAREIYQKLAQGRDPKAALLARGRLKELPSAGQGIAILETLLERVQSARRNTGKR